MFFIAISSITRGKAFRKMILQVQAYPRRDDDIAPSESVGDGSADAVMVALDVSTPQARRRKKVVSVGINDEGVTPTRARLNVLAEIGPQYRRRPPVPESEYRNAMPLLCSIVPAILFILGGLW
jgi:hypothetical protein